MAVFKRACLYIARKKGKMVVLLVILIILSSLMLIGTSVNKASDVAIDDLKSSLNGYIKIDTDIESSDFKYVSDDVIDAVTGINEITEYNTMNTYYMLTPEIESLPARFTAEGDIKAKLVRFLGCRDTSLHEYFMSNTFSLVEGRHITPDDTRKVLVSYVMAEINNLNVGDRIAAEATLEVNGVAVDAIGTGFDYEIIGIFNVTQATEIGGLTPECDVPENFIMTTQQDGLEALEILYGFDTPRYLGGAIFFTEDPSTLHDTAQKVESSIGNDLSGLAVTVNDTLFRMSAEPLERLGGFMNILSLVVFGVSIVLLSLILTMWMRERVRETGVYLAIGISKPGIFFQHFIECMMIAVVAFVLAWGIAGVAAGAVGNAFIENMPEETFYESQDTSLEKEMLDEPLDIEYEAETPATVEINIGFEDWIFVVGIEVFVIFVSVGLSSIAVLRMKPKNILSIME